MSEFIHTKIADGVLTLTMARPAKKNALTSAMYAALADAMTAAESDPAVRAILFLAEGDAYSAGNDMADFAAQAANGRPAGEMPVTRFLKALARADKPLVAAVTGLAVGVGTTMLLHCDLVYASPEAKLSTPFVNLALVPEAASSLLLPQRIGHARAAAMFMLGEALDAPTAQSLGLVNKVLPSRADAQAAAQQAAAALAAKAPSAIRATKRLMRDAAAIASLMEKEGTIFARQVESAEAREAFTAFLEKRPADFSKVA